MINIRSGIFILRIVCTNPAAGPWPLQYGRGLDVNFVRKIVNILNQYAVGGEGGGGLPPEIGKIVVEIWCYLPEVYIFGAESEIQEIFSKNCEKKSIFHIDFDQKI